MQWCCEERMKQWKENLKETIFKMQQTTGLKSVYEENTPSKTLISLV